MVTTDVWKIFYLQSKQITCEEEKEREAEKSDKIDFPFKTFKPHELKCGFVHCQASVPKSKQHNSEIRQVLDYHFVD